MQKNICYMHFGINYIKVYKDKMHSSKKEQKIIIIF